jgi:hypothetical protein
MDSKKWEAGDLYKDKEKIAPFNIPNNCCITQIDKINLSLKCSIIISGGILNGQVE